MLQRLRQSLTLTLLLALPFHAFIVTVGTRMIEGPGHAPAAWLALWKEELLLVILGLAFIELVRAKTRTLRLDVIDALILGLIALALIIRPSIQAGHWTVFVYGFKYDLLPLVAYFLLRRVPWSEEFLKQAFRWILVVGTVIAVYGIATLRLPDAFFTWLGYSDLHSLYRPDAPLAAFQQIGGTEIRRIQSVMSGPNQLGLWLLLPWTIALECFLSSVMVSSSNQDTARVALRRAQGDTLQSFFVWIVIDLALFFTFSRAAWIAAAVIALILVLRQWKGAWKWLIPAGLALVFAALVFKPDVIIRAASSRDHWERPLRAVGVMLEHPFGMGLGSAGPASNRFSDSCVFLEPGSNTDWAIPHPDLCVFVGGAQVQPVSRICNCPLIPENWYLQIGIELGVLGAVLYVLMIILVLKKLRMKNEELQIGSAGQFAILHSQFAIFLWLLGLTLAGLVLHSFEDAAVAYAVWILAAVALRVRER